MIEKKKEASKVNQTTRQSNTTHMYMYYVAMPTHRPFCLALPSTLDLMHTDSIALLSTHTHTHMHTHTERGGSPCEGVAVDGGNM